MKKCNSCKETNEDNAKFCIKCGDQLSNFTPLCPNCKSVINPGDVFCIKCGKKIIKSKSKQKVVQKKIYKYIEKPVKKTGRNRNFKIFIGLISGLAVIAVITVILVFVVGIGNLTNPFKSRADKELTKDQLQVDIKGLTAGESTHVANAEIGSDGKTLSIDEGILSGFSIEVPTDSFAESVQFDVSTAPVLSHEFGEDFNPASPLITIDNGSIFADKPMVVTIPIQKQDDEFAMAFFYDEKTRELMPLPLLSLTNTELVTMTQHFSKIVVSKMKKDNIKTVYDTKFKPKVDDFQIPNEGSYIAPGGHCLGTVIAQTYYYLNKDLNQGIDLYGRFDNDGYNKTPNYWEDDADVVRLVSSIQIGGNVWDNPTKLMADFKKQFYIDDSQTYYAMLYAMMVSKQPQIIDLRDGTNGHAVLAYKITPDAVYIADPNYPGDGTKHIPITKDSSGNIKFGIYNNYNKVGYYGLYAIMNESITYALWLEVIDGGPTPTIAAADFFPDDIIIEVVTGKDKNGKEITVPLIDGLILNEEAVEGLGMGNNLMARVTNGKTGDEVWMIMDTGNRDMGLGTSFDFAIEKGVNHIRILHMKNGKYVNFYRYDLIYGAKLTANPKEAKTGEDVSFNIDFDGSPYTFKWDFGDGAVSTIDGVASAKHIYTKEGTYAVSADIYNKAGDYLGKIETAIIVELELTLSANPNPVLPGEAVSLSTNITNKDYRYKWNLGDGTKLDEVGLYKTQHSYSLEGAYTISVEVYDGTGKLLNKAETTLTVKLELTLSANPNPAVIGEAVSLSTNITNKDYRYKWNLGDGTKLDEVGLYKTQHSYSLEGAYTISVEVYDGTGKLLDKAETAVTVKLELTLSANTWGPAIGEAVSLSTNITNKDYRYKWDLGDGTILDEVGLYKTKHTYGREGAYVISVEVYDGKGKLVGTVDDLLDVYLYLELSVNPNPVTLGEAVSFSTNTTYSTKDYRYKWDFGDGTILDEVGLHKTEHIYSLAGEYVMGVYIYDGRGRFIAVESEFVTVDGPEVITSSNSEIVGTWICQWPPLFYSYDNSVSYVISTFVINSDGTCFYEYVPVIIREPSEEIEYQERQDLIAKYPLQNPSWQPPEYESGHGDYAYFGKGHYFVEDKVGAATILLISASSQYEFNGDIFLCDDKLVFYSTEFTKK